MTNDTTPAEGEVIDPSAQLSLVEELHRAEVDIQIVTAKRFPRSIKKFLGEAKDMACLTEEIASSCIYALPRGGKSIEGPSARLAEICLSAWGNCAGAARTIEEGDKFIVAQGVFRDYERNTAVTFEVHRRITDKNGRRFNDDMITVTKNAACSIAFRNAIFKGVPKAFWAPIYDAARQTAIGDASTLANRRAYMIEYFQKMGVTEVQVLGVLEKAGVEDIGAEDLLKLKGLATAIKDGDTTVDDAFPSSLASAPTGRSNLSDKTPPNEPTTKEPPTESTEEKPNGKKETTPKQSKKTQSKSETEPASETKPEEGIPLTAKARHQWLARSAMTSCGVDDESAAIAITKKWMLINNIGPSSLDKDNIFTTVKDKMGSIDWKPLFDEYIDEALKASQNK